MPKESSDRPITKHIEELVAEEHRLRGTEGMSPANRDRLASIEVELDQCWDLLRQRRAKREFGEDPDEAHVRPPGVVESYEQ